ncbi:MAG: ATP-dependent RecD-like DNA helicase, partial [Oscillospiraceae bacterium]|nr:ATP-dependent RecD-like DNA helicase [Oscillospiraceae bacterium]
CLHEKTLFCNEQSGYTVASYKTRDHNSIPDDAKSRYQPRDGMTAFSAVGNRLPTASGVEVELVGKWVDGKYGLQLSVESCNVLRPKTTDGIVAYLSSDLIKGIGEQTANAIVNRFGVHALDIIDKTPERLLEVPGITEKKLASIMEGYNQSMGLRDIMTELATYGVTPKKAEKILEMYGAQAAEVVKANPYVLCNIHGFGFKTVDEMALKNGMPLDSPHRISEGLVYALGQSQQSGHLFLESEVLCNEAVKLLGAEAAESSAAQQALLDLVLNERLCEDDGRIYLPKNYTAERETAKLAKEMIRPVTISRDVEAAITRAEKRFGINLADKQRDAVKMALTNNLSIITGGPGTGKTTVLKVVIAVYDELVGGDAAFAAPTGRASRRLSESVGAEAATLHSTLGLTAEKDQAESSLEVDFLVVDEVSMMDMSLTYQLFRCLNSKTKLLFVGDDNQLPSVGAGNVLRELLLCGAIPVTKLNVVHRQASASRINLNAHTILQNRGDGLMYGADFEYVDAGDPAYAAEMVIRLYNDAVRQRGTDGKSYGADGVQILSPMRVKGKCGTDALNKQIQGMINPAANDRPEVVVGFKRFRLFDKVMQTRNNDAISNGDIGRIRKIDKGRNGDYTVMIDFGGRKVEYGQEDMESIELAYATTIHKSQGSEYPIVIIPVLTEAYIMLQRNLIYTAITRAKEKVIIVGQKKALFTAIHRAETAKRNTVLGKLIAA